MPFLHPCPHCRASAVPSACVRGSSREHPAACASCGKLSHVLASTHNGISSLCWVLFSCSLAAALILESVPLFVAGMALIVAYNVWAWRRAELFPIAADTVRVESNARWSLVALAILVKIFSS